MIFTSAFVCVALFAAAQGAAVEQIEDIAFEFEGQQFHLSPVEKRQATNKTQQPDEVGATLPNTNSKNTNNNNNNNENNAQVRFFSVFFLHLTHKNLFL
jgi:hypothetical protein